MWPRLCLCEGARSHAGWRRLALFDGVESTQHHARVPACLLPIDRLTSCVLFWVCCCLFSADRGPVARHGNERSQAERGVLHKPHHGLLQGMAAAMRRGGGESRELFKEHSGRSKLYQSCGVVRARARFAEVVRTTWRSAGCLVFFRLNQRGSASERRTSFCTS